MGQGTKRGALARAEGVHDLGYPAVGGIPRLGKPSVGLRALQLGRAYSLMLHLLLRSERLRTLRELQLPAMPLMVAHHTSAEDGNAKRCPAWSIAFCMSPEVTPASVAISAAKMARQLSPPCISVEKAGFPGVCLVSAGLSFGGGSPGRGGGRKRGSVANLGGVGW